MPRNGSGGMTRVHDWTTDVANGLNIEADRMDDDTDDLANEIANSIAKDGQTTTTASIPFANGISTNTVSERTSAAGVEVDGLLIKDGTVETEKGSSVASASAPNIWTAGNYKHITGTTAITDFAAAPVAGAWRILEFDDVLTLTDGTDLHLPGGANITTAAGDTCMVIADFTDDFRVLWYTKAAVAPSGGAAVMVSTFDAKGDLLGGTGADTYSKVTVGANNTILLADSAQSTGLKWGDIDDLTEDSVPVGGDFFMTYDASASTHKKVSLQTLTAGNTEAEAGTSTTMFLSPGILPRHPLMPKAWGTVTYSAGTPTLTASSGITGIADTATGTCTVTMSSAMSGTAYAVIGSCLDDGSDLQAFHHTITSTTVFVVKIRENGNALSDPAGFSFVVFGDLA